MMWWLRECPNESSKVANFRDLGGQVVAGSRGKLHPSTPRYFKMSGLVFQLPVYIALGSPELKRPA